MPDKRIGLALFGTGRIGTVHYMNLLLNRRVQLRWVVEEDIPRAQALVGDLNIPIITTADAHKIYQDPKVEAVLVCTPSFTHEEIVKNSLKAGKAVFCEKPLAPTLEATKECYRLADSMKVPLFCAFNRRYDPQIRKIFNHIAQGDVGKVRVVKTCSRDPKTGVSKEYLMTSGGVFVDSAIHDIDMVCWLVGEAPTTVYALGHATDPLYAECDDVDSVVINLKFPGGTVACIEISRNAPHGYDQRLEVLGTERMMQSENKRSTEVMTWTGSGATAEPIFTDCCLRYADSYKHEMEHFLNVIEGLEKMEVTGETTILANTIAQAASQSQKTGQIVTLNQQVHLKSNV